MSLLSPEDEARQAGESAIIPLTGTVDANWDPTGYYIGVRLTDAKLGCQCGSIATKIYGGRFFGCAVDISHGCINHEAIMVAWEVVNNRLQTFKLHDTFTRGNRE